MKQRAFASLCSKENVNNFVKLLETFEELQELLYRMEAWISSQGFLFSNVANNYAKQQDCTCFPHRFKTIIFPTKSNLQNMITKGQNPTLKIQ